MVTYTLNVTQPQTNKKIYRSLIIIFYVAISQKKVDNEAVVVIIIDAIINNNCLYSDSIFW